MDIFVNGIKLHYEKTGSGAPLILLHGNGESHEIFDEAIPLLAPHFTVYAVDTRGHGNSAPVPEYHYADMAQDVIALIRSLLQDRPVLYGFSDGGIVALLVGMLAPALPARIVASGVNISPRGLTPAFLRDAKREWRRTRDPLLALMLTEPHLSRRDLAAVTAPVTLTAGEHDLIRLRHTRRIAAAIGNCSLRILRGETHESYIVHSPKIARLLLEICTDSPAYGR